MTIFKPAASTQACLKMGILGFAGSGKTYTASSLAIRLSKLLGDATVYFLDTETGSDWMIPRFKEAGVELHVAKTRSFSDLTPAVEEVAKVRGILIIDSVTHFWNELKTSYKEKNKRTFMTIADWDRVKQLWAPFSTAFVNSNAHIIMCGRAGYEYDQEVGEDGKKELIKTDVKMKAEGELGYEPSLLVLMERETNLKDNTVQRVAYVLKDRSTKLDGKFFRNPTFENFAPHIDSLNLGGDQLGIDASRNSRDMINNPNQDRGFEQKQKDVVLDEIATLMNEYHPSRSGEDNAAKIKLLKDAFGTAAWKKIETFNLQTLRAGFAHIQGTLEHPPEPQQQTQLTLEQSAESVPRDAKPDDPMALGQILPAVTEQQLEP